MTRRSRIRESEAATEYEVEDSPTTEEHLQLVGRETAEGRLLRLGPGALTLAELLALLGCRGSGDEEILALERRPETPALAAAFELGRRAAQAKTPDGTMLRSAAASYAYLRPQLAHLDREVFVAVLLDVRLRALRTATIASGTGWSCAVHPRDALTPVIKGGAAAVLFAHNHPSGDPTPSAEDRDLTRRLMQAAELLGIRMVDHLVVARDGYVSLREQGAM